MESNDCWTNQTNLIVNYLPQDFRNAELYAMFITIGPIASHRVMIDKDTGYSFGYGFVNYTKPEHAAKAIEKLNGLQVDNKKIRVAYASPCSRDELVNNNLYIKRLPRDFTEEKLQELFGKFGTITQKKLLKDSITGLNRGVGFVRFSRRSEAQAAIEALHDTIPPGGTENLTVIVACDQKKKNMAFYSGYLEGQKYFIGGLDSLHIPPSPPFKAPLSLPNTPLPPGVGPSALGSRTRLTPPFCSHPSQNVVYGQRGPLVNGHQRSVFRPPHRNNGNFPHRGTRIGFVRNIHQTTPVPSLPEHPDSKSRMPVFGRQNKISVRLNQLD